MPKTGRARVDAAAALRSNDRSMLPRLRYVPRPEATATTLSVVVSILLLVIKFAAYYATHSAAIFSDALESIVNVVASLVAAWSLYLAHQPADEQHPYGHGKAEFLAAGFEGGMILIAALVIIERAVEEMIQGPRVHQVSVGLWLSLLAGGIDGSAGPDGREVVAADPRLPPQRRRQGAAHLTLSLTSPPPQRAISLGRFSHHGPGDLGHRPRPPGRQRHRV